LQQSVFFVNSPPKKINHWYYLVLGSFRIENQLFSFWVKTSFKVLTHVRTD
jgi:hypothetical protein